MKLTLQKQSTKEVEVDVEFPIYRKHVIDSDYASETIIYDKVTYEDNVFVTRSVNVKGRSFYSNEIGFEIGIDREKKPWDPRSSDDYALGTGDYACTAEEYNQAVEKLKAFIAETFQ